MVRGGVSQVPASLAAFEMESRARSREETVLWPEPLFTWLWSLTVTSVKS